jgi:hypothetical protein
MVVVLPHGAAGGHALFATQTYEIGDTIVVDETPLFVIEECDFGAELAMVLGKLKSVFDGISDKDQSAVLALYCPQDDELALMDVNLAPMTFAKVNSLARRLYPSLTTDVSTSTDASTNISATATTVTENKMTRLFYIWKINSTRYKAQNSAIFAIHARMNHSCSPNAGFRAGTIRAQKKITAGQEITHCYLDMETNIASTPVRRHMLQQQFLFDCQCSRCSDPMDVCRIMKCPACTKHSLIPGFVASEPMMSEETVTGEIVATCALCSKTFAAESLPLREEHELEQQIMILWQQLANPQRQSSQINQIQQLHKSVLQVLGGAHWAAAALTKIRYDTDPMVNGFVILQWGEAHAKWCQLVLEKEIPLLAPMITFTIGRNCEPLVSKRPGTQQKLFEILGRRYWNDCYPKCRQLWGDADPNILEMDKMFAQSKTNNCRVDLIVCTDKLCIAKTDDTIQIDQTTSDDANPRKACAACGLAHYCDRNCQKEDWHFHKEVCKASRALKDLKAVVGVIKATVAPLLL